MLHISLTDFNFKYPSVCHDVPGCAHLMTPDECWIWVTNPADRIICVTGNLDWMFVITARLFFMDIPPTWFNTITEEDGLTVPWLSWGPHNTRFFRLPDTSIFEVGGSRAIWADGPEVRMQDFNPSTVACGIGKVVRKSTSFPLPQIKFEQYLRVTTYLPYVEVVSDHTLQTSNVMLDEEMVVMFLDVN